MVINNNKLRNRRILAYGDNLLEPNHISNNLYNMSFKNNYQTDYNAAGFKDRADFLGYLKNTLAELELQGVLKKKQPFANFMNKAAGALGGTYGAIDNYIAGGRSNDLGDAAVKVGSAVSTFNPLIGGIIGTVGTGINLLFGNNKADLANYNQKANEAKSFNINLDNTHSIANGTLFTPKGTNISRKSFGLLNSDDYHRYRYAMNDATDFASRVGGNAAEQYDALNAEKQGINTMDFGGNLDSPIGYSFANDYLVNGKAMANLDNRFVSMPNSFACGGRKFSLGGVYQTLGANFPTGLVHIDAGGTHELNPNEGVLMGTDKFGTPNLVELNEVIFGDYVFSNRLNVPIKLTGKDKHKYAKGGELYDSLTHQDKVLKLFEGMPYSDAAKKAEDDIMGKDYNNKTMTANTPDKQQALEAVLEILALSLEEQRQAEELREIQEAIALMSPEELLMLMLQMAAYQQQELLMAEQQLMQLMQLMQDPAFMLQLLIAQDPAELYASYELPSADLEYMENYGKYMQAFGGNLFAEGGNLFAEGGNKRTLITVDPEIKAALEAREKIQEKGDEELAKKRRAAKRKLDKLYKLKSGYKNQDKYTKSAKAMYEADLAAIEANPDLILEGDGNNLNINQVRTSNNKKLQTAQFNRDAGDWDKTRLIALRGRMLSPADNGRYDFLPEEFRYNTTPNAVTPTWATGQLLQNYDYNRTGWYDKKSAKWYDPQGTELTEELVDNLIFGTPDSSSVYQNVSGGNYDPLDYNSYEDALGWYDPRENSRGFNTVADQIMLRAGNTENTYKATNWFKDIEGFNDLNDKQIDELAQTYRKSDEYLQYEYALQRAARNGDTRALNRLWNLSENSKGKDNLRRYFTKESTADNLHLRDDDKVWGDLLIGDNESYEDWAKRARAYIDTQNENPTDPTGLYYEAAFRNPVAQAHLMLALKQGLSSALVALMDKDGNLITDPTTGRYKFVNYDLNNPNPFYTRSLNALDTWDSDGRNVSIYGVRANQDAHIVRLPNGQDVYMTPEEIQNLGLAALTPDEAKGRVGMNRPDGVIGNDYFYNMNDNAYKKLGFDNSDDPYRDTPLELGDYPMPSLWPHLFNIGINAALTGYNMLKPADYSNANGILNATKQAGRYMEIDPRYIPNYMTYKPTSVFHEGNRSISLGNNANRLLANLSAGNLGTAQAGTLALTANTMNQLGQLDYQGDLLNWLRYKDTSEYNKDTNTKNATFYNDMAKANQEAYSRAMQASLTGNIEGYKLRELIDLDKAKAISAGISGIGTAIGNMEQQRMNNNWLAWYLPKSGVNWTNNPKPVYTAAKGGKVNKKKKSKFNF